MRILLAVAFGVLVWSGSAMAQMQCYWYQGKQVCCTKVGNNTFCN